LHVEPSEPGFPAGGGVGGGKGEGGGGFGGGEAGGNGEGGGGIGGLGGPAYAPQFQLALSVFG